MSCKPSTRKLWKLHKSVADENTEKRIKDSIAHGTPQDRDFSYLKDNGIDCVTEFLDKYVIYSDLVANKPEQIEHDWAQELFDGLVEQTKGLALRAQRVNRSGHLIAAEDARKKYTKCDINRLLNLEADVRFCNASRMLPDSPRQYHLKWETPTPAELLKRYEYITPFDIGISNSMFKRATDANCYPWPEKLEDKELCRMQGFNQQDVQIRAYRSHQANQFKKFQCDELGLREKNDRFDKALTACAITEVDDYLRKLSPEDLENWEFDHERETAIAHTATEIEESLDDGWHIKMDEDLREVITSLESGTREEKALALDKFAFMNHHGGSVLQYACQSYNDTSVNAVVLDILDCLRGLDWEEFVL